MKSLLMSAIALGFAAPAAAQTAPQPSAHQGHAQKQPADHAGHAQHQKPAGGSADHSSHANCCGDATGNGRMDCCKGEQASQRSCCAKHASQQQAQPE